MNEALVNKICFNNFNKYPDKIQRFELGYGNYVYKISFNEEEFVLRMNFGREAYKDTIYWLEKLKPLDLPVPEVISKGIYKEISYLILTYIQGDDLGNVYSALSEYDKRDISREIVQIQSKVSTLPQNRGYGYLTSYEDDNYKSSWKEVIIEHLDRSRNRIKENKIFDDKKVDSIEELLSQYDEYFSNIKPTPFLDDLSSKNILINKGKVSGVIDFDWICFGDKLYYVALTNMALISLGYDTAYVDYLMEEMKASDTEKNILRLYTLIFCADFMSEKGMKFKDEVVEVNEYEVELLNEVYEEIYGELSAYFKLNH